MILLLSATVAYAQDTNNRSFEVIDPAQWEHAQSVATDMAEDWGTTWVAEAGHTITYGVVQSASDPNRYYFATTRDNGQGGTMLSIFAYSSQNHQFERLARQDNASDAAWYVVGHDNGYVVYAQTNAGYNRGACGEPMAAVADGNGALQRLPDSFDRSWAEGATAYQAAQADVQAARDRQTACEGQGGQQPQ